MPHMYNICHFLGEELLDSGLLGRGKVQEKLQEYIPLCENYVSVLCISLP